MGNADARPLSTPKIERSLKLRFHTQTAGCSLTWQQPYNNVVRTALQALAGVLGGTQSLHTNSLDEAFALPEEHAVTIALRTQQVIAHETGIAEEPDPFGGSYFVETLTDELYQGALDYIRRIDNMGGMVEAIEQGFPQREIADASYRYQREVESGERIIVGVNKFQITDEPPIPLLQIDQKAGEAQAAKLASLRARRDNARVGQALHNLNRVAADGGNTMPCILEAVRAYATLGEICETLRTVFGTYEENSVV